MQRKPIACMHNKLCHPQVLYYIIFFFSSNLVLYDFCLHFSVWWVSKYNLVKWLECKYFSYLIYALLIAVLENAPYRIIIRRQRMALITAMVTISWRMMLPAVVLAATAGRAHQAPHKAVHRCTIVEVLRWLLFEC